jgi:hypothetical protein
MKISNSGVLRMNALSLVFSISSIVISILAILITFLSMPCGRLP